MKNVKLWICGGVLLLANAGLAATQQAPVLGINVFPGIRITGAFGAVYTVQTSTNVAQSNSWRALAFVRLATTNMVFVDTSTPASPSRFYRTVLQTPPTNMVFIP